ncbi:MAG: NAD(P)/FAD-dependent oxidoreductase [Kordiimonadaceae bacterium]|nr:NAD(P)/FAD-dependent oxidoreductase [Kordiimonadaceae bacterium]
MHNAKEQEYDLIVIGSGLGGLTTAALMAKLKKWRVLVLERHYVAGGFTHSFRRPGGYEWDVGVHYVGKMGPGHKERNLFNFITDGNLEWERMPEPIDVLDYPGLRIPVYSSEKEQRKTLIKLFPHEAVAIKQYYKDMKTAEMWGVGSFIAATLPKAFEKITKLVLSRASKLGLMTTEEYLNHYITDPKLKSVLVSQWLAYGLPPSESAFGLHATVMRHYFDGGFFPKGGAGEIAKNIVKVIKRFGGDVRINHDVTGIILSNGKAVGVNVSHRKKTKTIYAPAIVSDAGVQTTFNKLLPKGMLTLQQEKAMQVKRTPSAVSLYLGLKDTPASLGFRGENHWIFPGFDHEAHRDADDMAEGVATAGHLSFPSLKDKRSKKHTAEFFSVVDFDHFNSWVGSRWKKRGKDYETVKADITASMLALIEERNPGFTALVDYTELSTPLSVEHFLNHPKGAIYGLPGTPEKFQQEWLRAKSPVPNLYLTGADILCVGIMPALLTGAATAGALTGAFGFLRVLLAAQKKQQPDNSQDMQEVEKVGVL